MSAPAGRRTGDLPGEVRLLLHCARIDAAVEAIESAANGIDWSRFVDLARWHGIAPLVGYHLGRCRLGPDADAARAILQTDFQRNAMETARLSMELSGLLEVLRRAGLRCVPVKGAVLAAQAYREPWQRQFTDLDLLIHPEDILAAKSSLEAKGYRGRPELTETQAAQLVRRSPFAYSFSLERDGGLMEVDLHWRPAEAGHPVFPKRLSDPWERLGEATFNGATIPALCREDTLLFLAGHAAKHGWERLRWTVDIGAFLETHRDLDWDDLRRACGPSGSICERSLLTTLGLAQRLFGVTLPPDWRTAIDRDPVVQGLIREVSGGLADTQEDWPLYWPRSFQSDMYFLRMADGVWGRGAYFLRFCVWRVLAVDAKDRAAMPLPGALSFLYYLFRPFRLLGEYGLGPLRSLGGVLRALVQRT